MLYKLLKIRVPKKIFGFSKWREKTFGGALSCSFAPAVNGDLTQDVQQVRTTAPITHSNYCLTGSDGSSKQADSSLLEGSLRISPTQAALLSAEATERLETARPRIKLTSVPGLYITVGCFFLFVFQCNNGPAAFWLLAFLLTHPEAMEALTSEIRRFNLQHSSVHRETSDSLELYPTPVFGT